MKDFIKYLVFLYPKTWCFLVFKVVFFFGVLRFPFGVFGPKLSGHTGKNWDTGEFQTKLKIIKIEEFRLNVYPQYLKKFLKSITENLPQIQIIKNHGFWLCDSPARLFFVKIWRKKWRRKKFWSNFYYKSWNCEDWRKAIQMSNMWIYFTNQVCI